MHRQDPRSYSSTVTITKGKENVWCMKTWDDVVKGQQLMLVENQERWSKTCFNEMAQRDPPLSGALGQEPTITKVNNKLFLFPFASTPFKQLLPYRQTVTGCSDLAPWLIAAKSSPIPQLLWGKHYESTTSWIPSCQHQLFWVLHRHCKGSLYWNHWYLSINLSRLFDTLCKPTRRHSPVLQRCNHLVH